MKRMPILLLIAAAAVILLQGTHAARADSLPVLQAPTATLSPPPAEPVRVAWDRVGAMA
ncbi:MAG: hypothetical protein LDL19_03840 [Thiobacillus sp.]|nr:hypothetical protein [Thiobacillus sp.]